MFYLCLGKVDIVNERYIEEPTLANKIQTLCGKWVNIFSHLHRTCFYTVSFNRRVKCLFPEVSCKVYSAGFLETRQILRTLKSVYELELSTTVGLKESDFNTLYEFH